MGSLIKERMDLDPVLLLLLLPFLILSVED